MRRGLLVFVYRQGRDCTNGGITATRDMVWCEIPDALCKSPADARELNAIPDGEPALLLERRNLGGRPYYVATVPARPGLCGPTDGGNLISTSDGRWPVYGGVHVHDRFDTWEDYERLSR
jgi:hypothetical protein